MDKAAYANLIEEKQAGVAIQVLNLLKYHHQQCYFLINQQLDHAVKRALSRFIRVEQQAIYSLANFVKKEDLKQDVMNHAKVSIGAARPSIETLLAENSHLMDALKHALKAVNEPALVQLLSYWLAALQIEHDELVQQIHGRCSKDSR